MQYPDEAEFYGHVLRLQGLERSVATLCVRAYGHATCCGAARRAAPEEVPLGRGWRSRADCSSQRAGVGTGASGCVADGSVERIRGLSDFSQ